LDILSTRWNRPEVIPGGGIFLRTQILEFLYVFCLEAFGAFSEIELDRLAFIQALESITLDRAKMHENIAIAFFSSNEAKPFGVIEPFHGAAYAIIHTTFLGLA
jgi:hypothetical protein